MESAGWNGWFLKFISCIDWMIDFWDDVRWRVRGEERVELNPLLPFNELLWFWLWYWLGFWWLWKLGWYKVAGEALFDRFDFPENHFRKWFSTKMIEIEIILTKTICFSMKLTVILSVFGGFFIWSSVLIKLVWSEWLFTWCKLVCRFVSHIFKFLLKSVQFFSLK